MILNTKLIINILKAAALLFIPLLILPIQLKASELPVEKNFATGFEAVIVENELYLEFATIEDSFTTELRINKNALPIKVIGGKYALEDVDITRAGKLIFLQAVGKQQLYHLSLEPGDKIRLVKIPLWLSILPPLIAILLALLIKEVIISLFMGVLTGAFIAGGLRFKSLFFFIESFFDTVYKYLIKTMTDPDHLAVIIFSLLIGGMVAIISRNGGMAGVVKSLSKYARSPRSAQFMTWVMGVAIFFDDYANTLIVGNTMRSITDKFKISREKLAYIVDSTAAPVAAIAFVTTWIGAELVYIADGIAELEGFNTGLTAYAVFLNSLKYAYYPVLTLIFILMIIYFKRDYGPMRKAEIRAITTGKVASATKGVDDEPDMEDLSPVANIPLRWHNAVIPVITVILVTITGLVQTGFESLYYSILEVDKSVKLNWGSICSKMDQVTEGSSSAIVKAGMIIGNADSFEALIWGSLAGLLLALILTQVQRLIKLNETIFTMLTGFKTMMPALVILCLAWSLAISTKELHTAEFITSVLHGFVNPYFMPALIFALSALIAFSTGSSWSTMAILFPLARPATWTISISAGIDPAVSTEILFNVICCILGAAVLGDHVSPISDTTILSSLASDCNHLDHVKTQMPYALTVGLVSIISITVAAFLGGNIVVNLLILLFDIALLFLVVRYVGKKNPESDQVHS